jgi:cell division protein FtsB
VKLTIILALSLFFFVALGRRQKNNIGEKHSFTWQEAKPSAESELDRLSQAFVQLADHSRPAIVQIRVTYARWKGHTDAGFR